MQKPLMIGIMTGLLLLPIGLQFANASVSTNGDVTITSTCGFSLINGAPIAFGVLSRDTISPEQSLTLNNTGSVTATITVSGGDWKDGSNVIHIFGNKTKFATTDEGSGTSYAVKHALNTTNGTVTFGTVRPPITNVTYWQLLTTLQNMPYSGALTQSITFTETC